MPNNLDKVGKKEIEEDPNQQVFPFSTDNLKTVNETTTPVENPKEEESGDPTSSAVPLSSDKTN